MSSYKLVKIIIVISKSMFPTLVKDNRRKGRSAGSLVDPSITLPKVNVNVSKEKVSARLEEKTQQKLKMMNSKKQSN